MELVKEGAWYARSIQSDQRDYLWNLALNCGLSAFISNMVRYDWFDWAVFDLVFTACLLARQAYAADRGKRLFRMAFVTFSMLQELVLVYLACSLEWGPSCGRWYLLQTARLLALNYWAFFGRQLAAALLILAASAFVFHKRRTFQAQADDRALFAGSVRFVEELEVCRRIAARFLNALRLPRLRRLDRLVHIEHRRRNVCAAC